MNKAKHIIVGMSGGVDSSVAALLLKEQGHRVEGLFMQNWESAQDDPHCSASQDLSDARAVCNRLKIPLHTVNFAKEYWDRVFQYFLDEYNAGRTPNPDIICNKEIKFKAFLDYSLKKGADYIATGHYACIQEKDGKFQLLKGLDNNKDQSYFLYTLNQHQLSHSLFPIGELKKTAVREIAAKAGFFNHAKKDSTGICFIGERKFKDFLNEYLLAKPGNIETLEGNTIGQHHGLMFHTIGQRQGLGIGGRKKYKEAPWYVAAKDIERNVLIVVQGHHNPSLLSDSLTCSQTTWIEGPSPNTPLLCTTKIRYRQTDQPCLLSCIDSDYYKIHFMDSQRAITPGQSAVFYQGEVCLGGGIINNYVFLRKEQHVVK